MMRIWVALFLVTACLATQIHGRSEYITTKANAVYNAIESSSFLRTESSELEALIKELELPDEGDWFRPSKQLLVNGCIICNAGFKALLNYQASGKTPEQVKALVLKICDTFRLAHHDVCVGVIDMNADILLHIINAKQHVTPELICGVILQSEECSVDNPDLEWTVDVDMGDKPEISNQIQPESAESVTVVQVTDLHVDPSYTPEGNADCGKPACCRSEQGNASTPEGAAGFWGDYRSCDTPYHALRDMLLQIKNQHEKIDYVYMTGDFVDHGVWDTSRETNVESITLALHMFKEVFEDIPVFVAMGNHEAHPMNVFAPPEISDESMSMKWLYETVADLWTHWLPEQTRETILQGGYYSLQVRPGFRLVALNNIVCYKYNWWVLYDSKDPGGQLKWLAETLLQAERDGEKVHILAHIPPGDNDCLRTYSREFRKIVDRFESTVVAQFNGHTHVDKFHIFYALDNSSRANNIAFDGGSGTTYSNVNPNYRVYNVDSKTWKVTDYESWAYNMTEANLHPILHPNWYKLYSFKEAFDVESVSPVELDKMVHRMAANPELIQQFYRFSVKNGDPSLAKGCDKDCMKERLCGIVTTQVGDTTQCDELLQEFQ